MTIRTEKIHKCSCCQQERLEGVTMLEHIGGRGDVPTFTCLECWCNARDKAKEAVDALRENFEELLKGEK